MRGPGGGAVVAYPSRSSKEFLCCPGLALPAPTGFRRPPYQSLPVAMVLLQVAWFASPLAPLANIQAGAHSAAEQRGGQQRRWAETSLQDWDPQPCSAAAANSFFFFFFLFWLKENISFSSKGNVSFPFSVSLTATNDGNKWLEADIALFSSAVLKHTKHRWTAFAIWEDYEILRAPHFRSTSSAVEGSYAI